MMRVSIERLRVWLLVGAGGLVLVIAAFLGYAHVRAHQFLKDLPGRLGADITRESDGFTYSQSSKGKKVYTIHASKMVQRKDGKTTLRNVGIVLYGQKQDRADRIYGDEFEYDQAAGEVRAVGEVHLDLQAPAPGDARGRAAYAAGRETGKGPAAVGGDAGVVHVTTRGLVFLQKLGVASTAEEIEFQFRGMNGRAKGADYNSDTGETVLQADVHVTGLRDGQPVTLTAAHAEMNRGTEELRLKDARYVTVGIGRRNEERAVSAAEAVAHLRADGSVDRMVGRGGVRMEQEGGELRGQTAEVVLSGKNRPETMQVAGGVTFREMGDLRQVEGRAREGSAKFDGAGRMTSAEMHEAAEVQVRERSAAEVPWSERTVAGDVVRVRLATSAGGRQWVQEGEAEGGARMLLVDRGATEATSDLRGDRLRADLVLDGKAPRVERVQGEGHTTLRRVDGTGAEDTSAGEVLEVRFRPGPGAKTEVESAVQRGGVTLTRVPGRKAGSAEVGEMVKASAAEAVYVGDGERLTLNGGAQVVEADSVLRARTVTMLRGSGDATAEVGVNVLYRQADGGEPVHVVSASAKFAHASGVATFDGGAGAPARLWKGASQVEAPVIAFDQKGKTLMATGPVVRTVLVSGEKAGEGKQKAQVMRVVSRTLRYADAERRAQFGGGVVVEGADGTIRAPEVVALLTPAVGAAGAKGTRPAGLMGGQVDRVTAEGGVEVLEPGRKATGERLVYTAADGLFVMTGTPERMPKVVDEAQGTTTGTSLEFRSGDNSVMVQGNGKGEGRVHTETEIRQKP